MAQLDARHWRKLADAITRYIEGDKSWDVMTELLWYFWEDILQKFTEDLVSRWLDDSSYDLWNSEEWQRFIEHYFDQLFRVDRIRYGWDEILFSNKNKHEN